MVRPALESGYFPGYQMHYEKTVFAKAVARGAKQLAFWFAGLWLAAWLTGCAAPVPEDSESWRSSQRERLIERAEARWQALIANDFEKAYRFQSPGYRAVASVQQFRGSFGSAVAWRAAKAKNVEYDELTSARVFVALEYASSVGGKEYLSVKMLPEQWLFGDGDWWYVSTR